MKGVLVTGKNGDLSVFVAKWLAAKHGLSVEQISLRGNDWKDFAFDKFDTVVHIAGVVPREGVKAEDFYEINYRLTEQFAKTVKKAGVHNFIYISSMAVYGRMPTLSISNGTIDGETPCLPTGDYGKSKLQAEKCLQAMESEDFHIAIIRVPSIYGKGKTEYLEQYGALAKKLHCVPKAFTGHYKSVICTENLAELIYLTAESGFSGVICPDDGKVSAFDMMRSFVNFKVSRIVGKLLEIFGHRSQRVINYYGTICYDEKLSDVFNGQYRVRTACDAIQTAIRR